MIAFDTVPSYAELLWLEPRNRPNRYIIPKKIYIHGSSIVSMGSNMGDVPDERDDRTARDGRSNTGKEIEGSGDGRSASINWTDLLFGARMTVDKRFAERVANSQFSTYEWNRLMAVTEFEITDPANPKGAHLVANIEKIDQLAPELRHNRSREKIWDTSTPSTEGPLSGRLANLSKRILRRHVENGDSRKNDRETAISLISDYTNELQSYLEENAQWRTICKVAASERRRSEDADDTDYQVELSPSH